jgi:hypothetical protein
VNSVSLCRFAEALRDLLAARSPTMFERRWSDRRIANVGWHALARARRDEGPEWETTLDEVDGLLLRLLDRVPVLAAGAGVECDQIRAFRLVELERLQHATAAALVGQRYGSAGLRTVIDDQIAPLGRRYFAFLVLAEQHPRPAWPLFARYLTPHAHHAFVGVAAEAARFYIAPEATKLLVALFESVRHDLQLRSFLSPRILQSLFVLGDPAILPFIRGLLTTGYTNAEPERCEITRALVMIRRFTGRVEPSAKFGDAGRRPVTAALNRAERAYRRRRRTLLPVRVI